MNVPPATLVGSDVARSQGKWSRFDGRDRTGALENGEDENNEGEQGWAGRVESRLLVALDPRTDLTSACNPVGWFGKFEAALSTFCRTLPRKVSRRGTACPDLGEQRLGFVVRRKGPAVSPAPDRIPVRGKCRKRYSACAHPFGNTRMTESGHSPHSRRGSRCHCGARRS
jgi:hypothetical protein